MLNLDYSMPKGPESYSYASNMCHACLLNRLLQIQLGSKQDMNDFKKVYFGLFQCLAERSDSGRYKRKEVSLT